MDKMTLMQALRQLLVQMPLGTKLATEKQLMAQFNTSRYRLRQALAALCDQGYLTVVQGSGYFVADPLLHAQPRTKRLVVGVVCTHIADYIFPPIISGIDSVLAQSDAAVMLANTHNRFDAEAHSVQMLQASKVDALIVEPTQSALANPNLALYRHLRNAGVPVVFINARYPELSEFPALTTADKQAEYELVTRLLAMGHQRILGIFQVDDAQGVARMNGFIKAYQAQPALKAESLLIMYRSSDNYALLQQKLAALMHSADPPTAVACYNDRLAIRVMSDLVTMGYAVPKQVSVVGFDDYELARYSLPGLTTVRHPKRQMGERAATMVLAMLRHQQPASFEYPVELVWRDSVAERIQ
ncbi:substrate-binding domain-containing protein [Lacticaseibacillus jixiensis]|uniref:substrate-binding domain-containing protein n=1 Tax=Lacticaseibacillus jixiensis TaxID=3231926 RepID=UPI0036F412B6